MIEMAAARVRVALASLAGGHLPSAPQTRSALILHSEITIAFEAVVAALRESIESSPQRGGPTMRDVDFFEAYYSDDEPILETLEKRFGVAKGTISMGIGRVKPLFCSHFEQRYTELIQMAHDIWKQIPDTRVWTRREQLILSCAGVTIRGRGAPRKNRPTQTGEEPDR